jgi:class 3 adenylate cyclase
MGKTPGQKAARVKGFKMSESEILRKIAVIFVTDVVGFSTLMAQNEELTLRSFRSCKEILDNLFEEHSGRIFNTAGDSVLAEFPSAVSAVICAVEFKSSSKRAMPRFLTRRRCNFASA